MARELFLHLFAKLLPRFQGDLITLRFHMVVHSSKDKLLENLKMLYFVSNIFSPCFYNCLPDII